jgi:LmbE family N-acetylglucosaminyl deacetylase
LIRLPRLGPAAPPGSQPVSRALTVLALLALLAPPFTPAPARAADYGPRPPMNAAEIEMALRRLETVGTVLFVAAHPDDENTAVLTWLENLKGVRAAYISMTRGDGGQNLIGDEKGDLLGVIRTQELLAARRIDGAEQFFTRALDFGYSKTPDETLDFWGRDSVLADVVRTIRQIRPDLLINRFPADGGGGHGHHTASAILAIEALAAAGDPARFPEQVARYGTWKPKRVLWNWFTWTAPPDSATAAQLLKIDIGDYQPLLGKSSNELAADSRSMHRSQGFGSAERRGSQVNYFRVVAGDTAVGDPFQGIDLTWKRIPGAEFMGPLLAEIRRNYDPRDPAASVPSLVRAYEQLRRVRTSSTAMPDAETIERKLDDLAEVIRSASGLWIEAVATDHRYVPGDSIKVNVMAVNRSGVSMTFRRASLRWADRSNASPTESGTALAPNAPVSVNLATVLPAGLDWRATQPYWLVERPGRGAHVIRDTRALEAPQNTPVATAIVELDVNGVAIGYPVPVAHRWVDRVKGEQYRPVTVAPPITVSLDEVVYLFPEAAPKTVRVRAQAKAAGPATLRIDAPAGWRVEPASVAVALPGRDLPVDAEFRVTPPAAAAEVVLRAVAERGGAAHDREQVVLDYDHIPIQTLFLPAEAKAVRLDLARRGERIGYVMGPGDEVPDVLRQAGYDVTLLTDDDLDAAPLGGYDAIVVGIRAYNSRDALKRRNGRLHDYVREGGTLVVQYNTSDGTLLREFPPVPLRLGRDRVTVEEAPVRLLAPDHPILATPNRIGPADFEGWTQERGLYFAAEWDSTYTPLVGLSDPGESEKTGALLAAPYGKGTFVYTGLAFWRQLPAGVPGAIRFFVNLVSARS